MFGKDITEAIEEDTINVFKKNDGLIPPPTREQTEGMWPWTNLKTAPYGIRNFRNRPLTLEEINLMLECGAVVFPLTMIISPIISIAGNPRAWEIECENKKLNAILTENLKRIWPKRIEDMLTALEYGLAVFEIVGETTTAGEYGITQRGIPKNTPVSVIKDLNSCYPGSISLELDDKGHLEGFTQRTKSKEVKIPLSQTFIITYGGNFRNKNGISILQPCFVFWYWYEIVWRAFLKYQQRSGSPKVLCKAPQRTKVVMPNGELRDAMAVALDIAMSVSQSDAVAIPSDKDPETGRELWSLEYLKDDKRGDQFINALHELSTLIMRSLMFADRALTQDTNVGSYNLGGIHRDASSLNIERILRIIVNHINEYLIPKVVQWNIPQSQTTRARLITGGLDQQQLNRIFELAKLLINSKQPDILDWIDSRSMLSVQGIPMKTEEEFRRAQEEREKRRAQFNPFRQSEENNSEQYKPEQNKNENQPSQNEEEEGKTPQSPSSQPTTAAITTIPLTRTQIEQLREITEVISE